MGGQGPLLDCKRPSFADGYTSEKCQERTSTRASDFSRSAARAAVCTQAIRSFRAARGSLSRSSDALNGKEDLSTFPASALFLPAHSRLRVRYSELAHIGRTAAREGAGCCSNDRQLSRLTAAPGSPGSRAGAAAHSPCLQDSRRRVAS